MLWRIHGQLTLLHIALPIHLFLLSSMTHQFFSKAHQPMSKAPTTAPQNPYNARQNRPPIHPPPPVPPPSSTASLASLKPPAGIGDTTGPFSSILTILCGFFFGFLSGNHHRRAHSGKLLITVNFSHHIMDDIVECVIEDVICLARLA